MDLNGRTHVIMNTQNGMVIHLSKGKSTPERKVQLWRPHLKYQHQSKHWRLENPSEGAGGVTWYNIVHTESHTCIEVDTDREDDASTGNVFRLVAKPVDKGKNSQQWKFVPNVGGGTVQWFVAEKESRINRICNRLVDAAMVNINGTKANNGQPLHIRKSTGSSEEGWMLLPVLPFDTIGGSMADGPSEPLAE